MVDHILEFPRQVVSDVNCFRVIIPHETTTILKSSLNSHVYWDTLYNLYKDTLYKVSVSIINYYVMSIKVLRYDNI